MAAVETAVSWSFDLSLANTVVDLMSSNSEVLLNKIVANQHLS